LDYVENMVLMHMRPNQYVRDGSRVPKYRRMFDESLCPNDLILLSMADSGHSDHEARLFEGLSDYHSIMKRPMVMGRDLIAAGIKPGPHMTDMLARAKVLHFGGLRKEAALREILREWRAGNPET